MATNYTRPEWRARNKPMQKMNAEQLQAALAARDRVQAVSDEIRGRLGLPIVPESPRIMAARGRLVTLQAKASKPRPSKSRKVKPVDLSPEEQLKALARRRVKLRKELAEADREVIKMRDSKSVPVTRIAKELGVSRQAVYQLSGSAS